MTIHAILDTIENDKKLVLQKRLRQLNELYTELMIKWKLTPGWSTRPYTGKLKKVTIEIVNTLKEIKDLINDDTYFRGYNNYIPRSKQTGKKSAQFGKYKNDEDYDGENH